MRSPIRAPLAIALAFGAFSPEAASAGDDKTACIAASEKAQQLRDDGKLIDARQQMVTCARDACPAAIRKDCSGWLTAIDTTLPTIVIGAQDAEHHDLINVKVTMDGQPLVASLNGKAIPIDPGPHTFKFEAEGQTPLEKSVLVREGEQHRTIAVQFVSNAVSVSPAATSTARAAPPPAPEAGSASIPTAAYVLGGVGAIALGGFIGFALKGTSDLSNLRSTCGVTHSCAQSDVDSTRTKLVIGDVSLGVSIVALGIATYLVLSRGSAHPAKTTGALYLDIAPIDGASSVGLRF